MKQCNLFSLAAVGMLLASCAGSKIKEASVLGKTGGEIASNSQKPLAGMRQRVAGDLPIERIASLIGPDALPAPDGMARADRKGLQKSLELREKALNRLGAAYASFGALADYKAGETIAGEMKGLADAVNTYGKARSTKANPVSDELSVVLQQAPRVITDQVQLKMLRAASKDIRTRVGVFRGVLEHDRKVHLIVMQHIAGDQVNRYDQLVSIDPTAAQSSVAGALSKLGLKATDKLVKGFYDTKDGEAEKLLHDMFKEDCDGLVAMHMAFYDATIVTLRKLEAAHQQFEGERHFDPNALLDQAKELSSLADAYQKSLPQ
jgi:hypothetical protein